MKRILTLLILIVFVKSLVWSLFIPLWQFPDEQAHFGHVSYLAEGGQLPMGRKDDLSEEMVASERALGTFRDEFGNNRFTYHPEYRLEYTDNFIGKFEPDIKNIPLSARKNFVAAESAYYPHIFYRLSGLVYKLFYQSDLFVRVYSLRIFWLFTHLVMIYFAYQIGWMVFSKNKFMAISVAVLTGFQPMLSFVASGVSGDNYHNCLFTVLIYLCLCLWRKISWSNLAAIALVMAFGIAAKPQFLIGFGLVLPVLGLKLLKLKRYKLVGILAVILAVIVWFFMPNQIIFLESRKNLAWPDYTLWQHLVYTANHTFREVLPWYWGVFRWLSLTLPRWVNRIMMRILLLAGVGLIIKLLRRRFEPGFWIIVWSALVYFLSLFFWEYIQVRNTGFPFGLQGRYYFPTIVPHLILLIMGIRAIWSKLLIVLDYWFIALNWIAFYWVTASYYDADSFKNFIIQASQYKPDFAKGWWLITFLGLYFILSLIFSVQLFKVWRHEK